MHRNPSIAAVVFKNEFSTNHGITSLRKISTKFLMISKLSDDSKQTFKNDVVRG